jgi:hypothetical protein
LLLAIRCRHLSPFLHAEDCLFAMKQLQKNKASLSIRKARSKSLANYHFILHSL